MVYIEEGKDSFLFGNDAQSLIDEGTAKFVKEKNPRFLIVDGYPTIFIRWKIGEKSFLDAKERLKDVIFSIDADEIILDHHIVRDIDYKEKIIDIFELAVNMNKRIITTAEFLDCENLFWKHGEKI